MISAPIIKSFLTSKLCPAIACSQFVRPGRRNNYSLLARYKDAYGIYIFFGLKHEPLYIGSSGHGDVQRLRKRVTQHLTAKDDGGSFRKNFAMTNSLSEAQAAAWILQNTYVRLAETPAKDILLVERLANALFRPKYCRIIYGT